MQAPHHDPRPGVERTRGNDSAADTELKKQRRRIMNRKNQRARRQRAEGKRSTGGQGPRPYRVDCWRLDELDGESSPENTTSGPGGLLGATSGSGPRSQSESAAPQVAAGQPLLATSSMAVATSTRRSSHSTMALSFPLSMDHLLRIIQYNVLTGLKSNKYSMGVWDTCSNGRTPRPSKLGLPDSLMPTTLQMSRCHSVWIDTIPFPRVRDNLIRWEGSFDHGDFLRDLVGETGNTVAHKDAPCSREMPAFAMTLEVPRDSASNQTGLIVWGEPHDPSSWELTPAFLAKWMWVAEGCEELLVGVSNRWRLARGDAPMRLLSISRVSAPAS